ncbi:hypothetical protein JCM6882_005054 [Rhodosporidiobolus microsporus]
MPPTSLANRHVRNDAPPSRPSPTHWRFASSVAKLPRRARAVLALALLLLVWRVVREGSQSGSATLTRPRTHRSSLLRFPPSSAPLPSARLHFASGAIQVVSSREDGTYDALWESGRLVRVEVPLGSKLAWKGEGGGSGELSHGKGDDCADRTCERISRVRLQPEARFALQQMRVADDASHLVAFVPPSIPPPNRSITLVTQFTLSRIARFERMAQAWDGPLSATIYLTDSSDIETLETHLASPSLPSAWKKVALTLVKPDYSLSEDALLNRLRYPINKLRNLAITAAPSPYLLVVDVDFVPSPGMASILSSRGIPLLTRPSSRNSRSPTLHRTALVIPTFALALTFNGTFPMSVPDVEALYTATPPQATLTDANAGHGPTQSSLFFSSPPKAFGTEPLDKIQPTSSYPVCFEPQWEPYYLLARSSHPLYDERFTDQGGDKQSHAALLNALGYEFRVMRDVWVMHPPKRDRSEEEWPAARLVRAGGKPDGSEADLKHLDEAAERTEDPDDHFNLAAQKDEARFRFFQDFLPEMEQAWGSNFRWPGGCGAHKVGERTFGRAKAHSVFGL